MAESFVGKPCPKCAYVRSPADAAPEWQCPKCDIVYAKFGQAVPAKVAPAARSESVRDDSAGDTGDTGQARLAHLATLANFLLPPLGTIVPIALWIVKSGEDDFTVDAAKEALNFQISTLLWAIGILLPALVIPPFVFVSMLVLVAVLIASIVLPIVAAIRVSEGLRYYYPYTLHIFGDGPAE